MLLLLLALAAAPSVPGPESLAVLPVLLGPSKREVGPVFDSIGRASRLRRGLRVMSIDDYYFHGGQDLARRALGCSADTECMAKQLAPFGARLAMVVVINEELTPPLVSLILLDGHGGAVAAEWAGQVRGGPAAVYDKITAKSADFLERLGFKQSGRIKVRVSPDQVALRIDQKGPDLGSSDTFTLLPGRYTVHGVAQNYLSARVQVDVIAGQETSARLDLNPDTSVWNSPWAWIGAGAVVLGTVVATTALITKSSNPACICTLTVDGMDCTTCP